MTTEPCICGGTETTGHVVDCPADPFDAPLHPWMTPAERDFTLTPAPEAD